MKQRSHTASGATIEHFNNDRDFDKKYNVAICCRCCNSSKGALRLSEWLKKPYRIERNINQETVSRAVRVYMVLKKRN
jgi:hypothetical protein